MMGSVRIIRCNTYLKGLWSHAREAVFISLFHVN